MTFWKTVGAYLTGWVIAQSVYNRVMKHVKETTWAEEKDDIADRTATMVMTRMSLQREKAARDLQDQP